MSTVLQNALIVLGALGLVGLGYFLFVRDNVRDLSPDAVNPVADQMLLKTQVFIQRRAELDAVSFNQSLFSDPRFTSLRSYTTPLVPQTVGKDSLFTVPPELQTTSRE